MDVQKNAQRFEQAVCVLPPKIKSVLLSIPTSVKDTVQEVRLRVGRPITLSCPGKSWFLDAKSQLHNVPKHCFFVNSEDIAQAVAGMCAYSVHTHQHELINGYISLRGGHRAGICGTAVTDSQSITAVREITSINLRIAREIKGAATAIVRDVLRGSLCGLLITGVPSSGKTTILRDLTRQLASGELGQFVRVAVVDERCELGAVYEGVPQNDLGISCDILSGYPKGKGILTAVRTLSPEVIVCDEIGSREEVDSMLDGLNCGVKIIAAAHARTLQELISREQIRRLIKHGAFEKIVRLGDSSAPGSIVEFVEVGEQFFETDRTGQHCSMLYHDRDVHGIRPIR